MNLIPTQRSQELPEKERIITLVQKYNSIIKPAVNGPNCIDPKICDGNCCFIRIDIPKVLANAYIEHGWAKKTDFLRGDVFTFVIDVDYDKMRCKFFDRALNGCSLHQTGIKPPQCWIYPTGLDPDEVNTKCKKAEGWTITLPENVVNAKKMLLEYFEYCKQEAKAENCPQAIHDRLSKCLIEELSHNKPIDVAGVKDMWDEFIPLTSESINIGLRSFCREIRCEKEFFSCSAICESITQRIITFLKESLPRFIEINGFKDEYTFMELKQGIENPDSKNKLWLPD